MAEAVFIDPNHITAINDPGDLVVVTTERNEKESDPKGYTDRM